MTVDKPTLRELNAATGKLDIDSGLVFTGFAGALNMQDRLYHGELGFAEPGDNPPEDVVSIESILKPASAPEEEVYGDT